MYPPIQVLMRLATPRTIGFELFSPSPLGLALLGTVAVMVAGTTIALGHRLGNEVRRIAAAPAALEDPDAPPSAAGFAQTFVGLTNAYAQANGQATRVSSPHCVEGSRGHYLCAYVVSRPDGRHECHLMQAEWTPGALSSFHVTLSGRAGRCGTVREAVRSLR
jgi:hypothetical protein